jgi:ankyrin repeat protein
MKVMKRSFCLLLGELCVETADISYVIRSLLKAGSNEKEVCEWLLNYFCSKGNIKAVRQLLDAGVSVNDSVIALANKANHKDVVELLRSHLK